MQRGLCRKTHSRRISTTSNNAPTKKRQLSARARTTQLKYAYRDAAGWYITTVDSGNAGIINSLAIDAHGYPHISYYYDYRPGTRLMSLLIIGVEDTVIAPSGHNS